MTESKIDTENESQLTQSDIAEFVRSKFYQFFKDRLGEDIGSEKQLFEIFENGMKEGSVFFVPLKRKQGIFGILNVNTVVGDKKISKNFEVDNETEAAFFQGLQTSIDASRE